jgi:hypothetical protein
VPELNIDSDEDTTAGAPILLSRRNGPGFHIGTGLLLNELLIYYRLERMGWKSDLVTCRVDPDAPQDRTTAVELPDGQIDDLGVDYSCDRSGRDKRSVVDRKAWVAHSLGANYQLYAERLNRPKFYATFGGALTLTTNHITERNARARLGVRLTAGGGMDYYFEDNVALNVEARYEFTAYGKDGTFTRNAYRAGEADNTVLAAVIEPMHTFSFSIGIRVFLRR